MIANRFITSILLVISGLLGCGDGKESLHEDDHTTPPHWPVSLSDAADRIEQRFEHLHQDPSLAQAKNPTFEELRDLIEWAPLVAADRDLSEQQWNPIYQLSESVRKQLPNFGGGDSLKPPVEELCKGLRGCHDIVDAIEKSQVLAVPVESEQLSPPPASNIESESN
jgi:hypothetical protein